MRFSAMVALAAVACAPAPKPAPPVAAVPDPLRECEGGRANALLGKPVDAALRAEAMGRVGAAVIRVIPPGEMVTMDYRGNRLNIDTDAQNRAIRFHCG